MGKSKKLFEKSVLRIRRPHRSLPELLVSLPLSLLQQQDGRRKTWDKGFYDRRHDAIKENLKFLSTHLHSRFYGLSWRQWSSWGVIKVNILTVISNTCVLQIVEEFFYSPFLTVHCKRCLVISYQSCKSSLFNLIYFNV